MQLGVIRTHIRHWLLRLLALLARPFVRRADGPVRRILYIKPDHLGDLLLATPALTALRQQFPAAQITALVGPWAAFVLERNPDVDAVAQLAFPGFERAAKRSALAPYTLLLREARRLRAERYDLAIIGRDDHWWGAALAQLAGIPRRVGFAVPECRPFLTEALPYDPRAHVTAQGLALVAESQKLKGESLKSPRLATSEPLPNAGLSPLNFELATFGMRYTPSDADEAWAADWLAAHLNAARFAAIHPGTGGPDKHWLPQRWAQVADALTARGLRVVLTGGPSEAALVAQVAGLCATPPLSLAGQTSVGQLAALLRRAALVLGVDSGPLHLAAAVGARTMHLYGPSDHVRFGPWGDPARHTVLRAGIPCSPCGVFAACPRGLAVPECMERITVGDVLKLF